MDRAIEEEIKKIGGLYYLPWIGKNYVNSNAKLLVLGESNYIDEEGYGEEEDWNQILMKQNFIKILDGVTLYRPLVNLTRAIYNKKDLSQNEMSDFGNEIAFSNIVQRPLKNRKERPTNIDFYNGWKAILEIIKIIKPKNIIVIGVISIEILEYLAQEENKEIFGFKKCKKKINEASPRKFCIYNNDEHINCIAIRHSSSFFSWNEWHKFIKKNISLS